MVQSRDQQKAKVPGTTAEMEVQVKAAGTVEAVVAKAMQLAVEDQATMEEDELVIV